jgi:hypothetical protein
MSEVEQDQIINFIEECLTKRTAEYVGQIGYEGGGGGVSSRVFYVASPKTLVYNVLGLCSVRSENGRKKERCISDATLHNRVVILSKANNLVGQGFSLAYCRPKGLPYN